MYNLPYHKENGAYGLLHEGKVAESVETLRVIDMSKVTDERLLNALYRDYTFLSSAYLLEECHLRYLKTGEHGLAKDYLPPQLAVPLT